MDEGRLRARQGEGAGLDPAGDVAERLPAFFLDALRAQYPADDVARVVAGCAGGRRTSLRANALKTSADAIARELEQAGIAFSRPAWSDEAFLLTEARERAVRELGAYERGELYLQGLSSQLPAIVLGPRPGADVLDMCAAPGGKTSQMVALTGGRAHITACEMHAPRAERLEHNLRLLGAGGVTVMRCDARRLDDFFSFDQILLDAPCSGSGTLDAGDARMPARFTPALLAKCVRSQRALLAKALRLLKPGGTLVYSTCSVLRAENEDVVFGALRAARARVVPIDAEALGMGEVPLLPCALPGALCVCPTRDYEGFFVAKLQRMG